MDDLRFGLASFVFLVSEKGYSFKNLSSNNITFWENGQSPKYDPYQVMGRGKTDCGYVVFNPMVFEKKFANDETLVKDLKKLSIRPRRKTNDGGETAHCYEPGHETEISDGVKIRCGRIKEQTNA